MRPKQVHDKQNSIENQLDLKWIHHWDKQHHHKPICAHAMKLVEDTGRERRSQCSHCGYMLVSGFAMVYFGKIDEEWDNGKTS